jgi:hypothetical protein
MIYPCKDCLVKAICREPCEKAEDIVAFVTNRNSRNICPFCESKMNPVIDKMLFGYKSK